MTSAYNTMTQTDATNALAACFEIDSLRKEFYDRIIIKVKKNNTYRFIIEYSENKFETSSKFIGSPTHAIDNLIFYNTKAEAVTNYIEYTATYDDNVCYLDSSNAPSKKRFVANAFRLHAVNSGGYSTLYVSEFYPVMYSVADVFYGRQINLSEGMTIATAKSKENVINISKDGFKMWGYAGNLHANIGLQDDGSYGAWFPQIRIGGSSWSGAPFKTNSDGTVSISASQSAFAAYVLNKGVISVEQTNPNAQTASCFYGETISNARLIRGIITNNDASSHDLIGSEYIFKQTKNFNTYYGMKLISYPDNTNYPDDCLETIYHQWGIYFGTGGTYAYNLWADKWFTIGKRTWVKGALFVENGDISAFNGIISTNKSITAGENIRAAGWLGIDGTDCQKGISLYSLGSGDTQYAIRFALTSELGVHGAINAGWSTYLTMKNWGGGIRGWIFKSAENGNVASIADNGVLSIQGYLDVYSSATLQIRLGNDGHIGCTSYIDAAGYVKCGGIDVNRYEDGRADNRLWLYPNHTYPFYIQACSTDKGGGHHGYVTGGWATYFGMSDDSGDGASRGWIFRSAYSRGNVASISCDGNMTLNGHLTVGSMYGISFNNEIWQGRPLYGIRFEQSSTNYCGSHGKVSVNAVYFSSYRSSGYGWIWQGWPDTNTSVNVASLDVYGNFKIDGNLYMSANNTIRQTNTFWGATLQIGYDQNQATNIASNAFIAASNGNLHMDCMQGAYQMYLNYHSKGAIYLQNTAENGGITIDNGGMLFSNNLNFANTTDKSGNANIHLGSIRGKLPNELIHMYRRVHIGSPNGWGSMDAPEYGLSTYGSATIGVADVNASLGVARLSASDKYSYFSTTSVADSGIKFQVCNPSGAWIQPLIINSAGGILVNGTHQTFFKNNGTDGTIYYYTGNISIDTEDGSPAIIGFHRYGRSGIALYSNGGDVNNALRLMLQSGANYALLHEGNHPYNNSTWLAPALVSLGATRFYAHYYSGGVVGYAYLAGVNDGQTHVYCDGKFWQNEGNYACVDTSGATFSNQLIINSATSGSYNEGIRLNAASNGYATIMFGAKDSTSGMVSGSEWTIIKHPNGSLRITSVNSESGGTQFKTDNSLNCSGYITCANSNTNHTVRTTVISTTAPATSDINEGELWFIV